MAWFLDALSDLTCSLLSLLHIFGHTVLGFEAQPKSLENELPFRTATGVMTNFIITGKNVHCAKMCPGKCLMPRDRGRRGEKLQHTVTKKAKH